MIVKDEADILGQTIESLLRYGGFSKIFIFDNNSKDDTFEVAQRFASDRLSVSKLDETYSDDLKYEMVYRHSEIFSHSDWFAILDGDEIYTESQTQVIEFATTHNFNCIEHNTAQFYFTEKDISLDFDRSKPAAEQRPYYLLNYGEPRIFKFSEGLRLNTTQVKGRSPLLKISPRKLLVYHFQYRSAQQLEKRLRNRIENNKSSNNWGHVRSSRLDDYIVPAKHLHRFNGTITAGLPKNSNLYKIRDNAAYTMANLNWLKKNDALTKEQLTFFLATKWQRLLRKIW